MIAVTAVVGVSAGRAHRPGMGAPAPRPTEGALEEAQAAFFERAWDRARALLDRALEREEGVALATAQRLRVEVELRTRQVDVAEDLVERLPAGPGRDVARGELLLRLSEFAEAREAFLAAWEGSPSARAALGLGRVAQVRADLATAGAWFERAAELDPGDPETALALFDARGGAERLVAGRRYVEGATYEEPEVLESVTRLLDVLEAVGDRAPCRVQVPDTAEVPLRRAVPSPGQTALLVPVDVGSTRVKRALFDTGVASLLVLDRRTAKKAGVELVGEASLRGVGDRGVRDARFGLLSRLALGALTFEECLVEIVDASPYPAIVGLSALTEVVVRVDAPRGTLQLERHPRAGSARWGQDRSASPAVAGIAWRDALALRGKLYAPVEVSAAPRPLLLALDSGATRTVLALRAARDITRLRPSSGAIAGLSGIAALERGGATVLQLGPRDLRQRETWAADLEALDAWMGYRTEGILGVEAFLDGAVALDVRNARIGWAPTGE